MGMHHQDLSSAASAPRRPIGLGGPSVVSRNVCLSASEFNSAPPAVAAVATGEVALTIATPPAALSLMQDGKVRALAVGDQRRLPQMGDVPKMIELGIADDPLIPNFFGLVAPAGTPGSVVEQLNAGAARAIAAPEIGAKLEASGLVPSVSSPSDMARLIKKDVERFGG